MFDFFLSSLNIFVLPVLNEESPYVYSIGFNSLLTAFKNEKTSKRFILEVMLVIFIFLKQSP